MFLSSKDAFLLLPFCYFPYWALQQYWSQYSHLGGLLGGGAGAVLSVDLTGVHSHSHSRHLRKAA